MTRPVAKQIKATGREDASSIPIRLAGSDIDAGDAVISFRLSNLPGNGTLFLDAAMTRVAKVGTSYLASGEALQLYFKPAANFNVRSAFSIRPLTVQRAATRQPRR
jgi:hypothetical protein